MSGDLLSKINPWKKWNHLPWKHFMNPFDQWKVLPTFLIGEYLAIAMVLVSFRHAIKNGRLHLLAWVACFITGTANDVFFMWMPLVDNFWQAQATIMITPRLPLYICCMYNIFMYYSMVSVWRLKLPALTEACLTGLLAEVIYSPYDIVGIKFVWWTWHDTDPPIASRILGAPCGSSLWVITFAGTFSFLFRQIALRKSRPPSNGRCLATIIFCALLSTPIMMVQMALIGVLCGDAQGQPTERSLIFGAVIYLIIAIIGKLLSSGKHPADSQIRRKHDFCINLALVLYFLLMAAIMAKGRPETHISNGVHQTYGQCHIEQKDWSGTVRYKYLCANDFDEDWSFNCSKKLPKNFSEWYTVCGKAHSDFSKWMKAIATLATVGIVSYSSTLRFGM